MPASSFGWVLLIKFAKHVYYLLNSELDLFHVTFSACPGVYIPFCIKYSNRIKKHGVLYVNLWYESSGFSEAN